MTTLAEVTLLVAKQTMSVQTGIATAGAANALTDTVGLAQANQYWDKGTLWLLSGTHAGKVVSVTRFSANKLSFASLTTSVGLARYAVARAVVPYEQLVLAINQALEDVKVTGVDETLTGNGATSYTLPSGVKDVYAVEVLDANGAGKPVTHWRELNGKLIFRTAPSGTIRILFLTAPAELSSYNDVVNGEINLKWLKWAAAANALRWGMRVYQNDPTYKFDEFLNEALKRVETLRPLRGVRVSIQTAR